MTMEYCQAKWRVQCRVIACGSMDDGPRVRNVRCVGTVLVTDLPETLRSVRSRGELSYLAPLGSENISAPYFKQCFFRGGGVLPPRQSNTTPPIPRQK